MAPRLHRQRGVAVITALLLTTLAVTIVASLFWQQQVQVRSMENQRLHLQTKWILRGGLDWARLILQQDRIDNPNMTTETGAWATPLAETRLDDYVERERVANEKFDATLSGRITDAQARYNLTNLAANGVADPVQTKVFQRLLQHLQLNPGLAQAVADEVALSQPAAPNPSPSGGAPQSSVSSREPLELIRVEDLLAVAGFTPQAVEKLREFVIVLPGRSKVNVNTAPPEVLASLVENYSVSEAATLVQFRLRTPFIGVSAFTGALAQNGRSLPAGLEVDIKSDYFLVLTHVKLDRAALDAQSLIFRAPKAPTLQWMREI
ncbi:type II secretion system minor pseudopilin GspK [Pseudoduganella aquatica]|uniref:Type II secretion system protein K n=1 Tax=Pseudoduganella aquatica TaxID=2660641 RepID=A0A7X4HHK5_9BURK|nr:type II secretion system minor pseudopilin GspK [Pseudoduganella aquatica]MYN10265.1 type II secretion system minor pseudopilin GspK [Pseudoduganella aquatica]